MDHAIIVKPSDGTAHSWKLVYCEWNGWNNPPGPSRLVPFKDMGGEFVGVVPLDPSRQYRITCTVTSGFTASVNIDPECTLDWPYGEEWPVTVEGGEAEAIYFATGAGE